MLCMIGSELGHREFGATFENLIQIKGKELSYKCPLCSVGLIGIMGKKN